MQVRPEPPRRVLRDRPVVVACLLPLAVVVLLAVPHRLHEALGLQQGAVVMQCQALGLNALALAGLALRRSPAGRPGPSS